MRKVAIGILSNGVVSMDFTMVLMQMVMHSLAKEIQPIVIDQRTSIIQKGRHEVAAKAVALGVDSLLFVDTDMIFPSGTLVKLLDRKVDIVGCNYLRRREPFTPTARDEKGNPYGFSDGIEEVHDIGTGCLLISTKVLKAIGEPYFNVEWVTDKGVFRGEDYCFCDAARAKGFKVFCDHSLSRNIAHMGTQFNILQEDNTDAPMPE